MMIIRHSSCRVVVVVVVVVGQRGCCSYYLCCHFLVAVDWNFGVLTSNYVAVVDDVDYVVYMLFQWMFVGCRIL